MPRRPRIEHAGAIHHVIAKGSAREFIVRDDDDREVLLEEIAAATQRGRWACLAYCLLSTHFHLVVATPAPNLGPGMQRLLSTYAREFNLRHTRAGNLFHTRFHSSVVKSEAHLLSSLIYVYLNAVRAGLADAPESWPWSSYASTVGLEQPPDFVSVSNVLELFGGSPEAARFRLRAAVAEAWALDANSSGVRRSV